ncbi:MAG: hypothetical protein QXX87_03065 [Candidatus Jordarchaeales archaeon]
MPKGFGGRRVGGGKTGHSPRRAAKETSKLGVQRINAANKVPSKLYAREIDESCLEAARVVE